MVMLNIVQPFGCKSGKLRPLLWGSVSQRVKWLAVVPGSVSFRDAPQLEARGSGQMVE